MGLSPLLVREVFGIIRRINRDLGVSILLVEQNANVALRAAELRLHHGAGESGARRSAGRLMNNEDVKEFYLGGAAASAASSRT